MKTKKILFVYTAFSTFVKTDFEILSSEFEVVKYHIKPPKGIGGIYELIKQFFYLMFKGWKYDAFFIWFADYHSFLPVLFAKILNTKSFVVIGGYDVANIPELSYGSLSRPIRKLITLFSFKNATLCLPVVESLERKLKEISPNARTKTIYTGYKIDDLKNEPFIDRKKIVLTVSSTDNHQRFLIKGLDRFKELAELLTEFQFYVIGINENARQLFNPIPTNLALIPPLKQSELTKYYKEASIYAQFSRSEGLPNALCEAMLYGCIPIGTKVGGIPTGIGSTGLVMNVWDAQTAKNYITNNHNKANREACQKRIKEKFDWSFRREKLLKEINQI